MFKTKIQLIIFIFIILAIGNEIYKQISLKPISAKSTRLECHKKNVTFERVLKPLLIKDLLEGLKTNNYKTNIWADKSKHMQTKMFQYVNIKMIEKDLINKIQQNTISTNTNNIINHKNNDILIDIMIYENDKKDPSKKTKKSKLYAGYIEVTFKLNTINIYKIQTDFMNLQGKDIPQRITCIINSVMSLKD